MMKRIAKPTVAVAVLIGMCALVWNLIPAASGEKAFADDIVQQARKLESAAKPKLKALLDEKVAVTQEAAAQATRAYQSGEATFAEVLEANQAVGNAQLDLCDTNAERVAVLERMLALARDYEKSVVERVKSGTSPASTTLKAKLNRLEIEITLERVKDR